MWLYNIHGSIAFRVVFLTSGKTFPDDIDLAWRVKGNTDFASFFGDSDAVLRGKGRLSALQERLVGFKSIGLTLSRLKTRVYWSLILVAYLHGH